MTVMVRPACCADAPMIDAANMRQPAAAPSTRRPRDDKFIDVSLLLVQAVEGMQPSDRKFRGVSIDQQRELDLRGGDRPDVDLPFGQRLERLGGDARMA